MARPMGLATVMILAALRSRVCYGLDLTQKTGLLPGTVYTTLRRLEKRGLVEGHWEDPAVAQAERRPRRRYYRLTPEGRVGLDEALAHLGDIAADLGLFLPSGDRNP